jgi:hypothetical protein
MAMYSVDFLAHFHERMELSAEARGADLRSPDD